MIPSTPRYFILIVLVSMLIHVGCSSYTIIDWVSFIKFNGITYLQVRPGQTQGLAQTDLGAEFAQVQFKLSGNVHDPSYRSKNGDAAFLEPGTSVFTVNGYQPTFRLAVPQNGEILLFEANTNPQARAGRDLLDIAGKVQYIGVNSEIDGLTELAAIHEPQLVTRLVAMVLDAPVNQQPHEMPTPEEEERYFIAFHLKDGTAVIRSHWLNNGELSRGIMLPQEFAQEIKRAVENLQKPDG
jgi:hypothetical protein